MTVDGRRPGRARRAGHGYPARRWPASACPSPTARGWTPRPRDLEPPFAVVDLDAFDANARRPPAPRGRQAAAPGLEVRPLPRAAGPRAGRAGFRGQLVLHAARGAVARRATARATCSSPTRRPTGGAARAGRTGRTRRTITVMVDAVAHLDLDRGRRRRRRRARCASPSTSTRAGARWAAACTSASGARRCTRRRARRRWRGRSSPAPALRLVGLMSYEAQIAGLGDRPPGRPWLGAALRAVQRASARELAGAPRGGRRRRRGPSRRSSSSTAAARARIERTAAEPAVTEVDGRLGPVRADAVRRLPRFAPRPAALSPSPWCAARARAWRRCWAAATSRRAPPGPIACPGPSSPAGLRLDAREGAGEVQTPVPGAGADDLRRRRPRLAAPRQGRRAVRALRRAAPPAGRPRRRRRCRPTAAKARTFL